MWRTSLTIIVFSISFASIGTANDLMVNPSDRIPRAPIGHRQPTRSDLIAPKSAFDGTVGANLRNSADNQADVLDQQIMEENKQIDRKISEICRGC
jgi:hypothetical protein